MLKIECIVRGYLNKMNECITYIISEKNIILEVSFPGSFSTNVQYWPDNLT